MTTNEEFAKRLESKLVHSADNLYIWYVDEHFAVTGIEMTMLEKLEYKFLSLDSEDGKIRILFEKKEAVA
jgi:hypothetical protein